MYTPRPSHPVVYIDAELVEDDMFDHEDKTAEYFFAPVDDDYDEVVVVDANDVDPHEEFVLLDLIVSAPYVA